MPYSNSVTLLDTEGGPQTTQVVARLWKLSTSAFGSHDRDVEEERSTSFAVRLDQTGPAAFSFTSNASFPHNPVGLSLQDANRVAPVGVLGRPGSPDTGWLFRSGAFGSFLPTTSPIDLIAARSETLPADVPSLLPAVPVTVDAATTITAIAATLAPPVAGGAGGGLDVTLTGETAGNVGFAFSGRLVPTPSPDVAEPTAEALALEFVNENEQLLGGANLPGAQEQALWDAVRDTLTSTLVPQIRDAIESRVANRIAGTVGRNLGAGGLPAGVVLSVRTVQVTAQSLVIRGTLGSFGPVGDKLAPPPSAPSGSCPLTTLSALGQVVQGLAVLRAVRDETLARTPAGRWAIDAWYRLGGEAGALLAADPRLAERAACLADEVAAARAAGRRLPEPLRRRAERLLAELAAVGSPELRATVAVALERGVLRLV